MYISVYGSFNPDSQIIQYFPNFIALFIYQDDSKWTLNFF